MLVPDGAYSTYEKLWLVVVAGLVILSFYAGLGSVPLFDKDEGAFCEATREMLETGNYLMPHMNYEPRYDKPILIYWLQAASARVFGMNEFALRLPSAVAASLWVLVIYRAVRRRFNPDTALTAVLLMAGTIQVTLIGKAAIADAVLNLFIAVAMFSFYDYSETRQRRSLYIGFAAMGLGFLTKGPVAILIPLGVTFFHSLSERRTTEWARAAINPVGLAIFLAINAPWYALAIHDQGTAILRAWFVKQLGNRMSSSLEGHSGPFHFYVWVVLGGLMPFTALFLIAARRAKEDARDSYRRFLLIWFVFVFIFFSLIKTKLHHYVIYGYPPVFILMALHSERLRRPAMLALPMLAMLLLLAMLPFLAPIVANHIRDDYAASIIRQATPLFGKRYFLLLDAAAILAAATVLVPRLRRVSRILGLGVAMLVVVNFAVMPVVGRIAQAPIREAALLAKAQNYDVVKYKFVRPSFCFYREGPLREGRFMGLPCAGDIVFTSSKRVADLGPHDLIYSRLGVVLARLK